MENGISKAIVEVMKELTAIEKGKENREQGYKYRGIDDFYNAVHPLFAKHGVFTLPEVMERTEEHFTTKSGSVWNRVILKVKYHFCASDGSKVEAIVCGEGSDSGDKGSNKAIAAAHKYALMQVLCVATDDLEDADAETPPEKPAQPSTKPEAKAEGKGGYKWKTPREWAEIYAKKCESVGVHVDLDAMITEHGDKASFKLKEAYEKADKTSKDNAHF